MRSLNLYSRTIGKYGYAIWVCYALSFIAVSSWPIRELGGYVLTYMDEFVDQLLRDERVCDIILPRIAKREVLEESGELGPRKSLLLDAMEGKEERNSGGSHDSQKGRTRFSTCAVKSININIRLFLAEDGSVFFDVSSEE
jgi:hypothetical protein